MEDQQLDISTSEKKKLLNEILQICEKYYRRGFQQGYTSANQKNPPTELEVANWRFKSGKLKHDTPPGMAHISSDLLTRLNIEIGDSPILQGLILDCEEDK